MNFEKVFFSGVERLVQYNTDTIDYQDIANTMRRISGADYAALNVFEENSRDFTTEAVSGLKHNLIKASKILGINLSGKKWKQDPVRDQKLGRSIITTFQNLDELAGNVIEPGLLRLIERTFRIGQCVVVKTTKNKAFLGDFTLIFRTGRQLINPAYVESFANITGVVLDRIQSGKSLFKTQQMLSKSQEIAGMGSWELDGSTGKLFCSDQTYRIYGISKTETMESNQIFLETVHPDDRDFVESAFRNSLDSKKNHFNIEHRIIQKKSGDLRHVYVQCEHIRDESGKIVQSIGSVHDITTRKLQEQELEKLYHEYQTVFNGTQDATFLVEVVNPNTFRLIRNNRYHQMATGLSLESLQGKTPEELLGKNLGERVSANYKRCIEENRPISYEETLTFPTGEKTWHTILTPLKGDHTFFIVGSSRDITEAKKSEAALRQSEDRFRQVVEHNQTVVWEIDSTGEFVYASPVSEKIWGYKPEELIHSRNYFDLHPKEGREEFRIKTLSLIEENSGFFDLMNPVEKADGSTVWVLSNGLPIFNDHDELVGVRGSDQDITEVKMALEALQESNRLKTAFLLNMSHEIRTPMNGILGFLELLKEPKLDDEEKNEYIRHVNQSGKRLLKTIDDIIELSKVEANISHFQPESVNVADMLGYLHGIFCDQAKQKGLVFTLSNNPAGKNAIVRSDRQKIEIILSNIISNAIKFTSSGTVEMGYYIEGTSLFFFVKDTGIGIPGQYLEQIFKRFYQVEMALSRPYEGLGIGLSIALANAKIIHGDIRVTSEPGKGSTFFLSIPYVTSLKEPYPAKANDTIDDVTAQKHLILIAEDDPVSARYLMAILKETGAATMHVENGRQAVDAIRRNPQIDLILMDIKMPVMDGIQATRKIRTLNPGIPIIAQTAYAYPEDREKFLGAGCNDYISKPIVPQQLLRLISLYIQKR